MNKLLSLLCLFTSLLSHAQNPTFTSFTFRVQNNVPHLGQEVKCNIYGDSLIVGIVPYQTNVSALVAYFEATDSGVVTIGGLTLTPGISTYDFSGPVELYLALPDKSIEKKYTVMLINTGLPAVYINTQNEAPVASKDIYVNGAISIYPNAQFENQGIYQENLQIKGRGNSTWNMPKKPYKIKLNKKASIFGRHADKEWVFLANYSDKTLMRNSLAFELGNRFGLTYTPGFQPVDLFLNGEYQGSYLLTDQVKIAEGRVDINEMDEDEVTDISGGYLMEVDDRLDEEFWFRTTRNVPFTIKEPSVNPQQFSYINQYIQQAEDALYGNNFTDPQTGYAAYFNTETFVNWYLVNELLKNNDAIFYSSVYLYKDKNSKLSMGPLWDFDIAAGNVTYNGNDNPQGWWIRSGPWISRLFDDPAFRKKVSDRWAALKSTQINTLPLFIDQMAATLEASQTENFHKWDILDSLVWPNPVATGSYQGEVNYLQTWLAERINWLDQQFSVPVINPFSLVEPATEQRIVASAAHPTLLNFSWQKSIDLVKYKWMLTTESGDFRAPIASSGSNNMGNDTFYSMSSTELVAILQANQIYSGDSVRLKWIVYTYIGTDSVAASQPHILNVKVAETLSPFALLTPSNNITAEPDQLVSLPFGWQASRSAVQYRVYFYTPLNQVVLQTLPGNNGHDTSFLLSKNQMQNLLLTYGTAKGDSLVATLRWTAYAYLPNTDSLKAITTNQITFFRKDSSVTDHRYVVLATPAHQSSWIASEDATKGNLFSWSSSILKTGDYFKLYCTTANAPLFIRTLTDTFVTISDLFMHTTLKNAGVKKGDPIGLRWNVYQFNASTQDSVKAGQDFQLQVTRERVLKPFVMLTPGNGNRIESFNNDSFADVTFTWENNSPAAYTLNGSVNGITFEHATGNQPSFLLTDAGLKEIFGAANAADSVTVGWNVIATEQDDSLECEPIVVKFVRHKIESGLRTSSLLRNSIMLYPNPVSGNTIRFAINDREQKQYAIAITDLTGKIVQSFSTSAHEFAHDISALNSGIYFCRITANNASYTAKFVVNKQ